jgi:hypothetical protein
MPGYVPETGDIVWLEFDPQARTGRSAVREVRAKLKVLLEL